MTDKQFALSVKSIVSDNVGRCLVIRRSALSKNNAGFWDLPGGKCDPGEDLRTALVREVREETGLEIRLKRLVGMAQSEMGDRLVVYLLFEAESASVEVRVSSEHDDFRWEPRSRLVELSWAPQFRDFINDYAAG